MLIVAKRSNLAFTIQQHNAHYIYVMYVPTIDTMFINQPLLYV